VETNNKKRISQWIGISLLLPPRLTHLINVFFKGLTVQQLVIKEDEEEDTGLFRLSCYVPFDEQVDEVLKELDTKLSILESDLSLKTPIDLEVKAFTNETSPWDWKKHMNPLRVTEHIVIKPPPMEYTPHTGEVVIEIKASSIFGDGTHSTTVFCLKALEDLFQKRLTVEPPKEARVLDAGTGTGILAIAAIKLGAKKALAIDVDPNAVSEAKRNVAHNQMDDLISVSCLSVEDIDETFELVLANLVPPTLLRFGNIFAHIVESGGFLIMSGMTANKGPTLGVYDKLGFKILREYSDGRWAGAILHYLPEG